MLKKNILFLGAHCDDIEFGCGATISKLMETGAADIHIRVLSNKLVDHLGHVVHYRDIDEQVRAMNELKVPTGQVIVEDVAGGQIFPECRQTILDYLYSLRNELNPDLIFVTPKQDVHQDHRTLHDAALKAFNRLDILSYSVINSSTDIINPIYVEVFKQNLDAKTRSIHMYKSMMNAKMSLVDYFDPKIIESQARVTGLKCGLEFAESFSPTRLELSF